MTPATLPLVIYQGATFRRSFAWAQPDATPVDLSGCTARMHIREELDAAEILFELTTENGRIVIDGPAGTLSLEASADETAAMLWPKGVYDLEILHPGGDVTRLFQGGVRVSREVTRQ